MSFERAERLDAMSAREKDGRTFWHRLGVAFPAKQGPGWVLYLDSMPAPTEGQYKIMLMPPKPRESGISPREQSGNKGSGFSSGPDEDIPFSPSVL